jgi:hypothetical protein
MLQHQREFLLMRIVNEKLFFKDGIYVITPSLDISYQASATYCKFYDLSRENEVMTDEEVLSHMINQGMWSDEEEKQLEKTIPGHIEYFKEEMYKAYFKSEERKKIKQYLNKAREEQIRLNNIRRSYDHMTCAGVANYAKLQYIVQHCTMKGNRKYNWSKYNTYDLMTFYQNSLIREEDIRELSHSHPWDVMWYVGKKIRNLFGKPAVNLTFDQNRLVMWSALYDSVYEANDPPPDDVIKDDDMLDGYLSLKRKNKISGENKITDNEKINNAQEVYVPVSNFEDAQKVDEMNSAYAKALKKQRFKVIEKHGEVNEINLPDVRQELMIQAAQKFSKGR